LRGEIRLIHHHHNGTIIMSNSPASNPFSHASDPQHVRIGTQGQNWIHIASQVTTQLSSLLCAVNRQSTASLVVGQIMDMCMDGPKWVAEGRYDMGITTPSWYLRCAVQGRGFFKEPLPLKVLAVFPHDDYLVLGVRPESGIQSLHDVRKRNFPLEVSMHIDSPAGVVLEELFKMYGFSIKELESWGGKIYTFPYSDYTAVTGQLVPATFNASFDEAIMTRRWHRITERYDLRYLGIEDDILNKCEAMGMERAMLPKGRLRGMDQSVPTIGFSGWTFYCRANLSNEIAYETVRALHLQQAEINRRFAVEFPGMTSPMNILDCDKTDTPIHPGAARYYADLRKGPTQ
jgi:TRAP-type uncharacterized transport system substrate-binding protein